MATVLQFPAPSAAGGADATPAERTSSDHDPTTHSSRAPTPDATGDAELLQRIAADDDEALRIFYRRYSGLIFSLAWRMLGDEARAEEVLQETFIRVWRAAITFDPTRGRVETWVVTIARNLALTTLRKRRTASIENHLDEATAIPDERDDPERAASTNDTRRIVREAVAQLPANQREVVLLAYFDGLTHAEIADRTGEPLGTVKSRLRLALGRLQSTLRATLGDTWNDILADSPALLG